MQKCISSSKIPLKQHQIKVVQTILKQRGLLVVHSTGAGKTLAAVIASRCILDNFSDKKVIVITPKSLGGNFLKEMKAAGFNVNDKRFTLLTSTEFSLHPVNCQDSLLIIDEAHNLRTKGGKIVKTIIDCAKQAFKVLLLTATPVVNTPYDIANLMAMIYGGDPPTEQEFNNILSDEKAFHTFFECKISFFSPQKEGYPSSKIHPVNIFMDKNYYDTYDDVETKFTAKYKDENNNTIKVEGKAFFTGLRQSINTLETPELSKIDWVMSKIKEGKKTLLYSEYKTSTLGKIEDNLKNLKISYVSVTGDMSKDDRNDSVKKYNNDKVNVMLISKAGGEGLDLKGTRYVIITEPAWNESRIEQIIGRAIRYHSHINLPENEQHVDVYKLSIIKPDKSIRREFALQEEKNLLECNRDKKILDNIEKDYENYVNRKKCYNTQYNEKNKIESFIEYKAGYKKQYQDSLKRTKEWFNNYKKISDFKGNLTDNIWSYVHTSKKIRKADEDLFSRIKGEFIDKIANIAREKISPKKAYEMLVKWCKESKKNSQRLENDEDFGDPIGKWCEFKKDCNNISEYDWRNHNYLINCCLSSWVSGDGGYELHEKIEEYINKKYKEQGILNIVNAAKNNSYEIQRIANYLASNIQPSIDEYVRDLSKGKQSNIEEFIDRLKPLSIETSTCSNASLKYEFETVQDIKERKKVEKDKKQEDLKKAPDIWEQNKCLENIKSGGYTVDMIKNYAKTHKINISEPFEKLVGKKIKEYYCAMLSWKLNKEYNINIMYAPWDDLLDLMIEFGQKNNIWSQKLAEEITSCKNIFKTQNVEWWTHHATEKIIKQLQKVLKPLLREKISKQKSDNKTEWEWEKCSMSIKKGGYTLEDIRTYAITQNIDIHKIYCDRDTACGILMWLILKKPNKEVLKKIDIYGSKLLPTTDLIEMAKQLKIKLDGIEIPLTKKSVNQLKILIRKSLE